MTTDHRDYERELERIVDGVVDSIFAAPEEELDEDLRAAGEDPAKAVARLRAKLADTVKYEDGSRRSNNYVRVQQELLFLSIHPYELPETAKQRMRLLGAAIHKHPQLEERLAAELQNLDSLTDEDVTSYLEQLAEAGLLEDVSESDE